MRCSSASGTRSSSRSEQTCCGQMHANTGYQRRGAAARAPLRARVRRRRRDRHAVAARARRWSASGYPRLVAELAGDERARSRRRARWRRASTSSASCSSTCSGVEDVGRLLPAPGHLPPDLPRPAAAARSATRRCACCARCEGIDLVELPEAETCCGFGGHVRGEERRHLGRDADRQAAPRARHAAPRCCTAADNSCLLHIGGGLSRARAGVRAVHLAEILATDGGRVTDAASPPPRARRWPTPSCGATSATRRTTIRAKRAAVVAEVERLGGAARGRGGGQGERHGAPRRAA